MGRKSFFGGAVILMAAGFVVRILGFVYRIYLSNLIGAEGMGLFQLISPVYSLVILTLTAGVSIAVSKMVAEELAQKHYVNLKRITKCSLLLITGASIVVSTVMYIYINFIVNNILKDERTYYAMLLLIPCIPFVAASSALKGYFYGIQDVTPTAISQIVEQIIRIGLVMGMATYFLGIGLEYACALATVAMAIGEMFNFGVLLIIYRFRRNKTKVSNSGLMRKRTILSKLVRLSIPISFSRFISSIMGSIEVILIPRRLLAGGLNYQQSLQEFGRFTGMAMPLLWFPSLVTSSLATTLVPAISEALSLKNYKTVNYRISKSVQLTSILGFISAAIFMSYPNEIGAILYKNENIGGMLYSLSYTCIFLYLQQTLLGILNGMDKQGIALRNSVIGSSIRIAFVYYCVPPFGIRGYVWGYAVSGMLVCILNLTTVIKATGLTLDFRNWLIKPGIVCLFMIFAGKYIYSFCTIFNTGAKLTIALTLLCNIIISTALMVVIGALKKEDLRKLLWFKK